jgi:hypothetical protein
MADMQTLAQQRPLIAGALLRLRITVGEAGCRLAPNQKLPALQKVQVPPFQAYSSAIRFSPACANTAVNRSPAQGSFAGPGRGIFLLAVCRMCCRSAAPARREAAPNRG